MSRDAEDRDHTRFMRLEGTRGADGEGPVVSMAAFQLHSAGIVNSVKDGHPGLVSDEYLNAISAETTITAAELCAAGLWERVEGGYEVLERDMVQVVIDQHRTMDEALESCRTTGGHEPDDEYPDFCRKCNTAID